MCVECLYLFIVKTFNGREQRWLASCPSIISFETLLLQRLDFFREASVIQYELTLDMCCDIGAMCTDAHFSVWNVSLPL